MRTFQKQTVLTFTFLYSTIALILAITFAQIIDKNTDELARTVLDTQLQAIVSQYDRELERPEDLVTMTDQLEKTADYTGDRVTLISVNGRVIYDSEKILTEGNKMENYLEREEVGQVFSGQDSGFSTRYSTSLGENTYYLARPIYSRDGEMVGLIRISRPVYESSEVKWNLVLVLILFGVISVLAIGLIAYLVSKRMNQSLQSIQKVADDIVNDEYSSRYLGGSYQEIDQLGMAINDLSLQLSNQKKETKQSNDRLNQLINYLVMGVLLIDDDRTIQMFNPAMSQILSKNLNELIGKNYIHAISDPALVGLIEDAYYSHTTHSGEITLFSATVDEKTFDATVVPILESQKNTFSLIVLLYDITEIRRLEKVRTDFVANASHELRTPITALKGFTETLLDGAMYDEETLEEFLKIMNKESERLDALVGDILQLSKLENRKLEVQHERVDLHEVVELVFKIVEQKTQQKDIALTLEGDRPLYIQGDENVMKQIFLNLVNNAILYTPEGGRVTVKMEQNAQETLIQVIDNGIGVPLTEQNRIFERFYRVDKARSRNAGGTGLGLSIVKHLVENSQGSIHLESQPGLGSNFIITLPNKQAKRADEKEQLDTK